MNLFKLLENARDQISAYTGRTQAPQEKFTISDRQLHDSRLSSEQEDPAGALRQAINELSCFNVQEPNRLHMNQPVLQETANRSEAEIQLANWGAEQGNWGQRFAA